MGRRFRIQVALILFVILLLTVLATVFALKPGSGVMAIAVGLFDLLLLFMFYRFLLQSKKDLRQFLLAFHLEKPGNIGTSKMLRHSKDDLNSAYHFLQRTIENHIAEKTGELGFYHETFDLLQAGLMVVNEYDDVVLINRYTKNLLFHPELKNMSGLARLNPVLADFLSNLQPGSKGRIQILVENEHREFLVHSMEMQNQGNSFRVFTLENIKKELEESELAAWIKLLETIDKRMEAMGFDIKQGIADLNQNIRYNYTKINLTEFFKNVVKQSVRTLGLKEDSFSIRLSNNDLTVNADEKALMDIFLAILKNSSEAMSLQSSPVLELMAELDLSCRVQLIISDNGEGISPESLSRVFVPFFSTKKGHAGLGLSRARKVLADMHGTIDLASEPGRGTFTFLRFL